MLQKLIHRFERGERQALAKVISLIEKDSPLKEEILKNRYLSAGKARVVGFTGAPGAGKSSLIDQLIDSIRCEGETVGVVAVDPTSPFSGGALLGDRIRMQKHSLDPGVYIRSMGARGNLGGLARSTREVVRLMDAFGMDWVMVETVGVGQTEVDIMNVAQTTVLVVTPNSGDGIQTMKAGIMEIADIFVVNKSDLPGADTVAIEIETMLSMKTTTNGRQPPIIRTSSLQGTGIGELHKAIGVHMAYLRENAACRATSRERRRAEVFDILSDRWQTVVRQHAERGGPVGHLVEQVVESRMDPYTAAAIIMDLLLGSETARS
jgi:LAO/AO transport system kinase